MNQTLTEHTRISGYKLTC